VLARELADNVPLRNIVVFETRPHLGGNAHTERNGVTGVMVHKYGSHILHTDRRDVWEYISRFGLMCPYRHKVIANTPRGMFNLPINLLTLNQFFRKTLPLGEARKLLPTVDPNVEYANFEDAGISMLGRELYENFIKGYTKKQWGCDPTLLPASILKRLPVRFDYNADYFTDPYQGIPAEGYTEIIKNMLEHPIIEVRLSTRFIPEEHNFDHVFYTGPIDAYFDYCFGRLGYRTMEFSTVISAGDFQGTAVINYTGEDVAYTRVHEYKHYTPWEQHDDTVVQVEFSKATQPGDEPYYPIRSASDRALLKTYTLHAANNASNVSFLGRLGTYRYLDMDKVIGESLDFAAATTTRLLVGLEPYRFSFPEWAQ
jgi:UDP-galactopyranose mutase